MLQSEAELLREWRTKPRGFLVRRLALGLTTATKSSSLAEVCSTCHAARSKRHQQQASGGGDGRGEFALYLRRGRLDDKVGRDFDAAYLHGERLRLALGHATAQIVRK